MAGPAFIDRDEFPKYLQKSYQDIETIYGDLSRLAVAFAARKTPAELNALYNDLGWNGSANGLAIHEAAKAWMAQHRPASA
jgi:hypothetical protein